MNDEDLDGMTLLMALALPVLLVLAAMTGGCGRPPHEEESSTRAYAGARELTCAMLECPEVGMIFCAPTYEAAGGFRSGAWRCSVHYERHTVDSAGIETWRTWELVSCNSDGGCWFEFPGDLFPEYIR